MSVYKIVDRTSGELVYIGQTSDLEIRKEWHYTDYEIYKDSNLYNHIRNKGGWDNMEFSILQSESDTRMRLLIENTFQLELHPMFYWICNRKYIPKKMNAAKIMKRINNIKNKCVTVPGKTLDLTDQV